MHLVVEITSPDLDCPNWLSNILIENSTYSCEQHNHVEVPTKTEQSD